jgi:hypothetical protein
MFVVSLNQKGRIMKTQTQAQAVSPVAVAALDYAVILTAEDFSPCTIIRAVASKFPSLVRGEMLAIADVLGLNAGTTARQYQEVRSGSLVVDGEVL